MNRYRLLARRRQQKNKNPTSLRSSGRRNLAALAEFLTRPQADPQIGATITVRRIIALVNPVPQVNH
jgi:hypothetical protein